MIQKLRIFTYKHVINRGQWAPDGFAFILWFNAPLWWLFVSCSQKLCTHMCSHLKRPAASTASPPWKAFGFDLAAPLPTTHMCWLLHTCPRLSPDSTTTPLTRCFRRHPCRGQLFTPETGSPHPEATAAGMPPKDHGAAEGVVRPPLPRPWAPRGNTSVVHNVKGGQGCDIKMEIEKSRGGGDIKEIKGPVKSHCCALSLIPLLASPGSRYIF